ncbi:MAG: mechanosensitive ion channel family protein [Acidobacteria bacterium]|nr:mechanosensitive ion channel family protein [Acidobacteriota bacterium]
MNVETLITTLATRFADAGLKLMAALVLWLVGRWLIRFAVDLIARTMRRQAIDGTLTLYAQNIVSVLLNIVLVMALLGFFGIETTSFAAVIAGASVAIGAAWAGLLANFAAGAFLVVLRPFKTGDFITAGGVTGTVDTIGMFVTTITSPDNAVNYVGNAVILGSNIQNFSVNPTRRVEITAPLAHSQDALAVMAEFNERIAKIPNVAAKPAPEISILSQTAGGCVLAVRPHTHTDHYWQVYFDTNRVIKETIGSGGFPSPDVQVQVG